MILAQLIPKELKVHYVLALLLEAATGFLLP